MPLVVVVVGLAVLIGWATGGRVRNLADAGMRGAELLFAGLALQVLVDLDAGRSDWLGPDGGFAVLAVSHGLILLWVIRNRRRPGMWLIGAGFGANVAVIWANGAMPVAPEAIARIGSELVVPPGKHELLTPSSPLAFLADRIPITPLRTIVSAGDLVLGIGLVILVVALMRERPRPAVEPVANP